MSAAETTTRTKAKTATAVNATASPRALRLMAENLLSTPEGRRALINVADALLADSASGNAKFPLGTTARSAAKTAKRNLGAPSRKPITKPSGGLL